MLIRTSQKTTEKGVYVRGLEFPLIKYYKLIVSLKSYYITCITLSHLEETLRMKISQTETLSINVTQSFYFFINFEIMKLKPFCNVESLSNFQPAQGDNAVYEMPTMYRYVYRYSYFYLLHYSFSLHEIIDPAPRQLMLRQYVDYAATTILWIQWMLNLLQDQSSAQNSEQFYWKSQLYKT